MLQLAYQCWLLPLYVLAQSNRACVLLPAGWLNKVREGMPQAKGNTHAKK
jgi:hypothetical protein